MCPGCGVNLPNQNLAPSDQYHASGECLQIYHELSAIFIMNPDLNFRTQHAVDAYGAQHSGSKVKNIRTAFSLIGLYLAVERKYTGRQVQQAHMELAQKNLKWSSFIEPTRPYTLTVADVLGTAEEKRNDMLMAWSKHVWEIWEDYHEWTRNICKSNLKYV
ncbi:DUF5946 family protein [Paenibacillus roseipurpureus]|uniref:DUF5946 family protein n=1 Tax=Paenibacillus roseopurpureus TaxID=2918901 RepID=A0AA96RN99_9BACL|nr:DUF5946 family protein [Paenibacillus sp. MBLB1832]